MNDHKNLINLDKTEFFNDLDENSSTSTTENNENPSQNKTVPDLREYLSLIDEELKKSIETDTEDTSNLSQVVCSVCGFKAKNNRGLKIHLNSCRKKTSSNINNHNENHNSNQTQAPSEDLVNKLISYRYRRRVMKRIQSRSWS